MSTAPKELTELYHLVKKAKLPPQLKRKVDRMLEELSRMGEGPLYMASFDKTARYIDWVTSLPWQKRSDDNLDLERAKEILDSTHYGLEEIKERILEYIAVLKLQKEAGETKSREGLVRRLGRQGTGSSPILLFVGLPGIGKTSIAYSIAEALNRQFIRIAMGGMGEASQLRGYSRVIPEAEPGQVIKGLKRASVLNPVLLLDEIDRVAETGQAEIMGALLELLDPEQNFAFVDYYIDFPFGLSEVMFICSANKLGGISTAVLDRLEIIQMPGYTDEEKIVIARDYLLPRQLELTGMDKEDIKFDQEVWEKIVRPFGFDAGIRTMERTINAVVRKCAKRKVLTGQGQFNITQDNVKEFLPK